MFSRGSYWLTTRKTASWFPKIHFHLPITTSRFASLPTFARQVCLFRLSVLWISAFHSTAVSCGTTLGHWSRPCLPTICTPGLPVLAPILAYPLAQPQGASSLLLYVPGCEGCLSQATQQMFILQHSLKMSFLLHLFHSYSRGVPLGALWENWCQWCCSPNLCCAGTLCFGQLIISGKVRKQEPPPCNGR